jgi:hypothetical protein
MKAYLHAIDSRNSYKGMFVNEWKVQVIHPMAKFRDVFAHVLHVFDRYWCNRVKYRYYDRVSGGVAGGKGLLSCGLRVISTILRYRPVLIRQHACST